MLARKEIKQMTEPDSLKPKEATILSLSEGIGISLSRLRELLDKSFGTHRQEARGDQPARENVLDIVIDNLSDSRYDIDEIIAILSDVVLPKIS